MDNQESLSFKIVLSATFWDKVPECSISINDEVKSTTVVDNALTTIEFDHIVKDGPNVLKIRLENKTPADTVVEEGQILKDMLLNIDEIYIDGLALGELIRKGSYHLDEKQIFQGQEITVLDNCVNLGWNGSYNLEFTSPFYLWLLENL